MSGTNGLHGTNGLRGMSGPRDTRPLPTPPFLSPGAVR